MANGSLEWFPPNRLATTFPEFRNLKGIPQVVFICPPMVEFGTALVLYAQTETTISFFLQAEAAGSCHELLDVEETLLGPWTV